MSSWSPLQSHFNAIFGTKAKLCWVLSLQALIPRGEKLLFQPIQYFSALTEFLTLLLFPQAMGLWTSEICKCISATNTEFCCFWDYLFMYLKMSVCEKFLIKCPGCKLFIDRIIIACLGWSLYNPIKITLKIKKENLTDKNWPFFFCP